MINLKKILGIVILFHAGYSLMSYRKFLNMTTRAHEFTIPLDVYIKKKIFN